MKENYETQMCVRRVMCHPEHPRSESCDHRSKTPESDPGGRTESKDLKGGECVPFTGLRFSALLRMTLRLD
jgi:hypothetical protein